MTNQVPSIDGRVYGPARRYMPYSSPRNPNGSQGGQDSNGDRRPKPSILGPADPDISSETIYFTANSHSTLAPSVGSFPPQESASCGSKTLQRPSELGSLTGAANSGLADWFWCLLSALFWSPIGAHQGGSSIHKIKSSQNPPIGVGGFSKARPQTRKRSRGGAKSRSTNAPLLSAHVNLPSRVHRPYRASQAGDSVMKVVRSAYLGGFNSSTSTETDNYLSFQLSDLQGYSNLTATFDVFRLKMVEVFFTSTINTTTPGSNFANPLIYVAVDFDSAAAQTINTILQYDTCEIHDIRQNFSVVIQPRIALAAYNGAFSGYAQGAADQWIDCASAGTQHYGLVFSQPSTTSVTQVEVTARYHLEFKRAR